MPLRLSLSRSLARSAVVLGLVISAVQSAAAQQFTVETRDPKQKQDESFAKDYETALANPKHGSPLVDHLPLVAGIPTPKDVLGYHIGAPKKLTYYADQLKYYRRLAAATGRVKVETIGRSDEGRELVVVWVTSEANMGNLSKNRANLAKIADPRGVSEETIHTLIANTKPHYHLMGGLHSGETGPSEMLMELVYRLATETSPVITQIRNNVYVSVTPVADADGRDRNVDWFYKGLDFAALNPTPAPVVPAVGAAPVAGAAPAAGAVPAAGPEGFGPGGRGNTGIGSLPYWGKYVYHDNNRDINIELVQMRAIVDWYFTAHPPIMHDLHEAQPLLYTYSGGMPQNPNLDPLLFAELPWYANFEMAQMTKYGMPGVYTNAFMDGWSPGYLGSVAYNHNGLMKMYETQSGKDVDAAALAAAATKAATATVAAVTVPAGNLATPPSVVSRVDTLTADAVRARVAVVGPALVRRALQLRRLRSQAPLPQPARRPRRPRRSRVAVLRRSRRARAARRIANGIAVSPTRSTTWTPSRAAPTRTTWRRASSRRSSSPPCSRRRCSRTSTSRRATRSKKANQRRRTDSSFPCSAI
jgi:hypothetical protein